MPAHHRRRRRLRREPVRDHHAVEAPLAAQDVGEQARVLGAVRAGEAVVGGHHRPRAGLAHGGLERCEIDLAQRALVHLGAGAMAFPLDVVGDEVLDAGADAMRLEPTHERDGESRRKLRVLRVALEVATADRRALDVHRRREQHARALRERLLGERAGDAFDQRGVPGGAERRAAREARRAGPAADAGAARAVRAVGHAQRARSRVAARRRVFQRSAPAISAAFSSSVSSREQSFDARCAGAWRILSPWRSPVYATSARPGCRVRDCSRRRLLLKLRSTERR